MTVWLYATFVRKDGSISKTIKALELIVDHEKSGGAYDQDIDGGIFLPNDTNEYFAVAMLKNSHTAATGDLTCSANIFIIGMNLSGDQANIFDTGVVIEKDYEAGIFSCVRSSRRFHGFGNDRPDSIHNGLC